MLTTFDNRWCNKVIEQGRGGKIEDREFLVDKIKARREFLISKGNSQGTTDAWLTRINLLNGLKIKQSINIIQMKLI